MWSLWMLAAAVMLTGSGLEGQKLGREAYVSVPQLIADAGYPVERHRARTADGYTLQLHRLPAGRRSARRVAGAEGKRPVLLVHGLFGSSGDFVIMGPRRSLAYLLADAGYDVWLGNLRGTAYSSHANFTKSDSQFWQFSFAEHGRYDLPAMIDAVLSVTEQEKLLYVGYSMGTTSFFVMTSERPEYNERVVAFVALAPAVYLDNVRQAAQLAVYNAGWTRALRARGVHAVSLRRELRALLAGEGGVCRVRRASDDVCMRLVYGVVGEDYAQNDWDTMPLVLARFQPASLRQLEHFAKIALTGEFVSWGAGLQDRSAATYELARTRVPVHLVYGENDMLTEKSQVMRLADAMKYPTHPVPWRKFNHLDFVYARDLDQLLNRDLVLLVDRLYNEYQSQSTHPSANYTSRSTQVFPKKTPWNMQSNEELNSLSTIPQVIKSSKSAQAYAKKTPWNTQTQVELRSQTTQRYFNKNSRNKSSYISNSHQSGSLSPYSITRNKV